MAVLKWDDVAYNPVATRGGATAAALLNDGITGFSDALAKYEARETKNAGVAGIAEAMKLTTAEQYRQAAKEGRLQINESNIDFFTGREKELLANEQSQVLTKGYTLDNQGKLIDQEGKRVQIEGWRIDNQGKIIDNEGKVIGNNQQALALEESKYNFGRQKDQHVAQLEAAPVLARISQLADSGTAEGRRQANALAVENAPLFIKAGQTLSDVKGISGDIRTQIEAGINTNEAVFKGAETAKDQKANLEGQKIFQDFYNNNSYINYEDAVKALNAGPGSAEAKEYAAKLLESKKAIMYPNDPNIETTIFDQGQREGATIGGAKPTGGALYDLVTGKESANRWDALYGQSQGKGGAFEGVDVTRMTIGDLDKFSSEYGPWVAERNKGVTATPMGMFQIVNKTLQSAAKEMGLPPDTVFDADTQTKIFQHLADKRLLGPRSMQTKLNGIREEWAALKGVSDTQLAAAITSYEQGDRNALSSMLDPTQQTAAAQDPAIVENALTAAAKSGQPLNYQLNQALFDTAKQKDAYASQLIQQMNLDSSFGGDRAAVLQELVNPTQVGAGQRGKMVKDAFNEVSPDIPDAASEEDKSASLAAFDNEVRFAQNEYNLTMPQAIAMVKGSTAQSSWWEAWKGNQYVDHKQLKEYIGSILDLKEQDPQKRMEKAKVELQAQAAKTAGAANIQQYQKDYQNAMTDYYSAAERRRNGQPVNDSLALQRVLAYGKRLQAELDRINANPVSSANIAAIKAEQ